MSKEIVEVVNGVNGGVQYMVEDRWSVVEIRWSVAGGSDESESESAGWR